MFHFELRYVAFAGDVRILQVRTRAPDGPWSDWDYIPDSDIPTVDAADVQATGYVRGSRPHVH
jgi:hypothetical protein